ncbi:MAG: ArnT family glycosyltransferase [Acidimicrobiia bacterium]
MREAGHWPIALVITLFAAIYATGLHVSPVYLTHDEVIYARNAYSIAHTGRDLSGQLLPVSIPVTGTFFATPANIYFTAAFLTVLPLSEVAVRLPSVIVGLLCAWLTYLIATRLSGSRMLATLAAVMLLLTPAHFMHSRLGTDHLYVVACVLGWLVVLLRANGAVSAGRAFVSSACLGASLYTYLGAAITAPVCLAIMLVWLVVRGDGDRRVLAAAVGGFVALAIPFASWHLTHPGQYAQQIRMYALYDSRTLDAVAGARTLAAPTSLAERAAVYWDYFNPSFLFFAGDAGLLNGTRYTGVFLLPMLALLPAGAMLMLLRSGAAGALIVAVFASAPIAAAVVAERYRINRALLMLPLASVLAAAAVAWAWRARSRVLRPAVVVLLIAMPLQFAAFYRDYFTDYRIRSAAWFEYNQRGAMEEVIARAGDADRIWISQGLPWSDYYWPFYLDRFGRRDLLARTHYFDPVAADLNAAPAGTYVLCRASEEPRLISAGFARVAAIREPDATHSLSVLHR